ncbi:MAG: rRNA pseudouridine synthase [candidate division KSB1 bacterium]|nr:rRNA pseudouridine synthase [candidate division KSB1 bacterium]MDZ7284901.1 rRNA pseudouridine synthase [candidate division KSB1 bacterium]MDZ7297678.1 rRNA pseudouridine synthase [candidate division KSB1 bacterium]MDZ7305898.1 rRNA pseudouridine synthase [candidate division KSB1 bacterium]MDZ7348545.1 rRNA pseudouridine synthase [candidate division KSB1 bacterium]
MLVRALSKLGVCSRQEARRAIRAGRVQVNGKTARNTLYWITLGEDQIVFDGQPLTTAQPLRYYMLHKPPGYVTTRRDSFGRPTVFDLMPMAQPGLGNSSSDRPDGRAWLFPVGRLDYDSEGLLLFTNDGPLADAIASPTSRVEKVYRVLLHRVPPAAELRRLEEGILLDGHLTLPAKVEPDPDSQEGRWLRITIHEGKNRQVRRMFAAVGSRVLRLQRIRIGPLTLGNLSAGEWRELTTAEVQALRRAVAQPPE